MGFAGFQPSGPLADRKIADSEIQLPQDEMIYVGAVWIGSVVVGFNLL